MQKGALSGTPMNEPRLGGRVPKSSLLQKGRTCTKPREEGGLSRTCSRRGGTVGNGTRWRFESFDEAELKIKGRVSLISKKRKA